MSLVFNVDVELHLNTERLRSLFRSLAAPQHIDHQHVQPSPPLRPHPRQPHTESEQEVVPVVSGSGRSLQTKVHQRHLGRRCRGLPSDGWDRLVLVLRWSFRRLLYPRQSRCAIARRLSREVIQRPIGRVQETGLDQNLGDVLNCGY